MTEAGQSQTVTTSADIEVARRVLRTEIAGLESLIDELDGSFNAAIRLLVNVEDRVIVSGIGKSGHIARKIAATFASTGTAAFFVHPAEASHGDLGMIGPARRRPGVVQFRRHRGAGGYSRPYQTIPHSAHCHDQWP